MNSCTTKWSYATLGVIAVIMGLISLCVGSGCSPATDLDNGWLEIEGLEPHPRDVPCSILNHAFVVEPDLEDLHEVTAARANEMIGREVFDNEAPFQCMTLDMNFIPSDADGWATSGGDVENAHIRINEWGDIIACICTLNVDFGYHRESMELGALHCAFHCLGLADDPGIDVTVELRSIMSNPIDPLGELTDHDRTLIWEWLDSR